MNIASIHRPKAQEVLVQLEDFFYEGVEAPPDYVDPNASAETLPKQNPNKRPQLV